MTQTLREMVLEALDDDQAPCKYEDEMSDEDVQAYLLINFQQRATLDEIFDIREELGMDVKFLEREIIRYMRLTISYLDTDTSLVSKYMRKAEDIFREHLMEWSEDFAVLQQMMYKIYCEHTPKPTGHYRTRNWSIGYSSFHTERWVVDKVQPAPPTVSELLERFDTLIRSWKCNASEL